MASPATSGDPVSPRGRRPRAPGVRAIAGGGLVTCAMLGVLVAPGGAPEPASSYLVTVDDLAPGEPIGPDAVERRPLVLPPDLARRSLTDTDGIEGVATRTAVPAGTVLHEGHLRDLVGPGRGAEVTIAVPERRALGGDLAVGDAVDVVATYGSGTEGFSEVIAAEAVVTGAGRTDDSLGLEASTAVTLRLEPDAPVLPVVHAAHADAVTLVLAGGAGADDGSRPFRPVPPEAAGP